MPCLATQRKRKGEHGTINFMNVVTSSENPKAESSFTIQIRTIIQDSDKQEMRRLTSIVNQIMQTVSIIQKGSVTNKGGHEVEFDSLKHI